MKMIMPSSKTQKVNNFGTNNIYCSLVVLILGVCFQSTTWIPVMEAVKCCFLNWKRVSNQSHNYLEYLG